MALNSAQKAFLRHCVSSECEVRERKSLQAAKPGARLAKTTLDDKDFAELIGVHPQTLKLWKRRPEFQAALKKGIEEFESSSDYFGLVLKHRTREELWANYRNATGAEKRHYLTMVQKEVGDVAEYDDSPDYEDMTDDDLVALCLRRDVSPLGMSRDELLRLANKGE